MSTVKNYATASSPVRSYFWGNKVVVVRTVDTLPWYLHLFRKGAMAMAESSEQSGLTEA